MTDLMLSCIVAFLMQMDLSLDPRLSPLSCLLAIGGVIWGWWVRVEFEAVSANLRDRESSSRPCHAACSRSGVCYTLDT